MDPKPIIINLIWFHRRKAINLKYGKSSDWNECPLCRKIFNVGDCAKKIGSKYYYHFSSASSCCYNRAFIDNKEDLEVK